MAPIKNANQLLEQYPNLQVVGGKLHVMCGDLFAISETGRNIRITDAEIYSKNGIFLEVKEFVLIDEGVEARQ